VAGENNDTLENFKQALGWHFGVGQNFQQVRGGQKWWIPNYSTFKDAIDCLYAVKSPNYLATNSINPALTH
jgi:hypothetical protein